MLIGQLAGLPVIRAFGQQARFAKIMQETIDNSNVSSLASRVLAFEFSS